MSEERIAELIRVTGLYSGNARQNAIDELAAFGEQALPALVAALESENVFEMDGAAQALKQMGKKALPALEQIIRAYMECTPRYTPKDFDLKNCIVRAGAKAVPALLKYVRKQSSAESYGYACALLCNIGVAAVPEVGRAVLEEKLSLEAARSLVGMIMKHAGKQGGVSRGVQTIPMQKRPRGAEQRISTALRRV